MLRYTEFGLSRIEVPDEASICIYLSGCPINCKNCHYPELQSPESGLILSHHFEDIISLYKSQASCVCFMGEGDLSELSRNEILQYVGYIKNMELKTCLYSGRDVCLEDWMYVFDYVKLGSYREEYGALDEKTTNQRLFRINKLDIKDITYKFWE